MEKNLNKIEEMNEEVKVEELTEETLDTVDGGCCKNLDRDFCLHLSCGIISKNVAMYKLGQKVGQYVKSYRYY